ncbi:MAG: hypothetical protein WC002_09155 [Candidatus Muiribacteriota bacterium]
MKKKIDIKLSKLDVVKSIKKKSRDKMPKDGRFVEKVFEQDKKKYSRKEKHKKNSIQ